MKVKFAELEKKVQMLDFMVYCITMHKTARYSWIRPVIVDGNGKLIDVTVNELAKRIGLKAEWAGAKLWETRCIKVPHWDEYNFDGYVLTHLMLQHMCPAFRDKQFDAREFCKDWT